MHSSHICLRYSLTATDCLHYYSHTTPPKPCSYSLGPHEHEHVKVCWFASLTQPSRACHYFRLAPSPCTHIYTHAPRTDDACPAGGAACIIRIMPVAFCVSCHIVVRHQRNNPGRSLFNTMLCSESRKSGIARVTDPAIVYRLLLPLHSSFLFIS